MNHKISIITVCFNDFDALIKTFNSISEQSEPNIEWIVSDGGSTDGTKEFLAECDLVSNYISQKDSGIYDAMNKGTSLSTGEYLIYLNAGDIFCNSDSLSLLSKHLNGSDITLAGANFTCKEELLRYRKPRPLKSIWHSIPANHQAIAFRSKFLGESPYNTNYKICGDYELLARLHVEYATYQIVDFPLVSFELGGVSTFSTSLLANEALKVQREVLSLPLYLRCLSWMRRRIATTVNLLTCLYKGVRS